MTFTVWESGVVTLWSTERVRVDKALFRPPPLSLSLSRSLHHSLTPNRKSRSYPRRCQMRNAFSGEQEHPTVQRTADSILRTSFSLYLCLLTGWQTAGLIGRCTGRLINCNTPPPHINMALYMSELQQLIPSYKCVIVHYFVAIFGENLVAEEESGVDFWK